MNVRRFAAAVAVALGLVSAGLASAVQADQIKAVDNSLNVASCQVTSTSPTQVTYDRSGVEQTIDVVQIVSIVFEGEPSQLRSARSNINNGAWQNALDQLKKIDAAAVGNPFIKQDIDFYIALCTAKLAMGGSREQVGDAGKLMRAFVQANANSWHRLQAVEVLGDLFLLVGAYDQAAASYQEVEQAPWPEYQMRGGAARGRVLLAQQKYAEALPVFEGVLALAQQNQSPAAQSEGLAATLGRAACLAGTGEPDQAVTQIQQVIQNANAEQTDLMAQAYLTLGNCYLQMADKKKEALLAFYEVDVLYFTNASAHAEALFHIASLWNELNKPERAALAMQTLKERYPNSSWAQ